MNFPVPQTTQDVLVHYDSLDDENERYRYVDFVMSIPSIFKKARPWCVDIFGKDDCDPESALESEVTPEALAEMQDRQSSYPSEIRKMFDELEIPITESGGGCGGWHIGSVCTQDQADRLCAVFHKRFASAIEAGLLRAGRHWWGHDPGKDWRPNFWETEDQSYGYGFTTEE